MSQPILFDSADLPPYICMSGKPLDERRRLSTASSGERSSVLSSFSSLMRAATHPFLVVFAKQSGLLKRGRTRSGSFSSTSPGVSSYAGGDGS